MLKVRDEESKKTVVPVTKKVLAVPKTFVDPAKAYVIIGTYDSCSIQFFSRLIYPSIYYLICIYLEGGLNDFGLQMANFLVTRGAKKLVLVSDSGVNSGFQSLFIRRWKESGVDVVTVAYDTTKPAGAEALLKEANQLGPVAGIFQLEDVLHGATVSDLTASDFSAVFDKKVASTTNLDQASRKLCPQLERFFVWSSGASGHGSAGQANHGYADAVLAKLSEARQAAGYPSVIIL